MIPDEFAWSEWQNHGGLKRDRPRIEPPFEFNIAVLNNHGRIERSTEADRIYLTCKVCDQPLGSVPCTGDIIAQGVEAAKRGLRKHLRKRHNITDPYA